MFVLSLRENHTTKTENLTLEILEMCLKGLVPTTTTLKKNVRFTSRQNPTLLAVTEYSLK